MKKFLLICFTFFAYVTLNAQSDSKIYYYNETENTVELDLKKINDYYERLYLLYSVNNDNRFVITSTDEYGLFYVSNNGEIIENQNFSTTFDTFFQNRISDFALFDKITIAEMEKIWKDGIANFDILSLMMDIMIDSAPRGNNDSCYKAEPFCTDNGLYTFQAVTGNNHPSETGPSYDCLSSQPCPSWYYMKIATPGNFTIHMEGKDGTTERDIDFCCWGPYNDPIAPCPHIPGPNPNGLTADKVVDCSYSSSYSENCDIPSSAQTGQYYILIITNYSKQTCIITFSKTEGSGPGTTDCSIMPPVVDHSNPCYGGTMQLTAQNVSNATYSWTGPNGFTSNIREPHIDNVTFANSGTYGCSITVPGQGTSDPMELDIEILPVLHAGFTASNVIPGATAQFTGTETTTPAGYTNKITSRTWNFGDGTPEVSGANPTHVYTTPGTYEVTYTIVAENESSGTCEDVYTSTVCAYNPPTVSYSNPCYGSTLQLSAQTVSGVSYSWTGPNGFTSSTREPHIDNVTFANSGTYTCAITVPGECTSEPTEIEIEILPELHAGFTASNVIPGATAQFTGTETTTPAGYTNKITSRTWNFGDGTPEVSGVNPTHVYTTPGTYEVTYTIVAENESGGTCEDVYTSTVCAYNPPTVSYSSPCYGSTLQLSAQTVSGVSYSWTGPNGFTSSTREPHIDNVTFANSGTYTCAIAVPGECTGEPTELEIEILPELHANFTVINTLPGVSAQFTGTETTTPAGYTNKITSRTWNFGDGSPEVSGVNPTHIYTIPGSYDVTYTIVAENVTGGTCEDVYTVPITVSANLASVVSADDNAICQDEQTTLRSYAYGGTQNYTYSWSPANLVTNPTSAATTTTQLNSTTTFTCTVSDGFSVTESECTVTVYPKYMTPTIFDAGGSCDPYVLTYFNPATQQWEQKTYYQTTDETLTIGTVHGCDSVVRILFTKYDPYEEQHPENHRVDVCKNNYGEYWWGHVHCTQGDLTYGDVWTNDIDFKTSHGCDSIAKILLRLFDRPLVPLINDLESKEIMAGSSWMPLQYKFELNNITGAGIEQGLYPPTYNWSIEYHVDWTGFDNTSTWILNSDGTNEATLLVMSEGNATICCDITTLCGVIHRRIFVYTSLYGIDENDNNDLVSVYPNPTDGSMHLDLNESMNLNNVTISLYNSEGIIIKTFTADELADGKIEYPMDNLANGLYLIKITGKNINIVKRLTLSK